MTEADWLRIIDEGVDSGQLRSVQFIGGEPLLHRSLPMLANHALDRGLQVEVFSNLSFLFLKTEVWLLLKRPGASLATSFYSGKPEEHELITTKAGSYKRTRDNIARAVKFGIDLRVGIIQMLSDQAIEAAWLELTYMGVPALKIGFDRLRSFGRGAEGKPVSKDELCGHCADGVAAIMPDGSAKPCVFWRGEEGYGGNVLEQPLLEIMNGPALTEVRADLAGFFALRKKPKACLPSGDCPPRVWCPPNDPLPEADRPAGAYGRCKPVNPCWPDECPPRKSTCPPKPPEREVQAAQPTCRPNHDKCGPKFSANGRYCPPNTESCWPHCLPNNPPPPGFSPEDESVLNGDVALADVPRCTPATSEVEVMTYQQWLEFAGGVPS